MYICTLSLTPALEGVDGQRHAPAALSPGKTRYQLYRRLGGPQGQSGRVPKISLHRNSIPGRPALSESLYQHHYQGPQIFPRYRINFRRFRRTVKKPKLLLYRSSDLIIFGESPLTIVWKYSFFLLYKSQKYFDFETFITPLCQPISPYNKIQTEPPFPYFCQFKQDRA